MGKPSLNDDDKDMLQELLGSPGWRVILNFVVHRELNRYNHEVFQAARMGDHQKSLSSVSRYDAVLDLLKATYESADFEKPDILSKLRRGI